MEIVLYFGTFSAQNEMVSVISRMEGRGGKMYSFCAMYSLRMSFWSVPPIFFQSAPCFSATARYIASAIGAVELMVIETVTSSRLMPPKSVSMSASESMATPHLPTSPALRSEEHTSELQSQSNLVCRLLLEKKK